MARPQAKSTRLIDDERVRVTRWDFDPGAETGWHRHEMDYVIVPVTNSDMTIVAPDGTRSIAQLRIGKSYFRKAGVEHDVINIGDALYTFVEVELKRQAG